MSTSTAAHRPDRTARGTWSTILPLVIPPAAWTASLGLSWAVQDFTCSAMLTAGAAVPGQALFTTLLVINLVLLAVIILCGALCLRTLLRARRVHSPLQSFLGLTGVALAVLFGFGVVMIGSAPFVFEIC